MLNIRRAVNEDYETICPLFKQIHELHVQARQDIYKANDRPVSLEMFEGQLADDSYLILVAENLTQTAGVAVLHVEEIRDNAFMQARKILILHSLCVQEDLRGQKIGSRLVKQAVEIGKQLGAGRLELSVAEWNREAVQFYEAMGLTTRSRRMEYIL